MADEAERNAQFREECTPAHHAQPSLQAVLFRCADLCQSADCELKSFPAKIVYERLQERKSTTLDAVRNVHEYTVGIIITAENGVFLPKDGGDGHLRGAGRGILVVT